MRGSYDAVAVFGWRRDIAVLERYIPKNMRIVFGGRQGESERFTYVGADNFAGAETATSHLIDRGCKNILTITGDLTVESGRERLAGYKSVLAAAGMQVKAQNIIEGNYSRDSARKSMTKSLTLKVRKQAHLKRFYKALVNSTYSKQLWIPITPF